MAEQYENRSLEKIDIIPFLTAVLKHWWAILLLGISFALLADGIAHLRYKPVYQSQSVLVVSYKSRSNDISRALSQAQSTTKMFSSIIQSEAMQRKVEEELGVEKFPGTATAKALESTNLMTLTVRAGEPMTAFRTIRCIIDNYSKVTDYVMDNVLLEVLEEPSIPKGPVSTVRDKHIMIRFFLIGIAAGIVLFGMMNILHDTVKKESDISEKIAARHLGTIYRDKQGKKRVKRKDSKRTVSNLLITNPMLSFRFTESTRMTATRVQSQMDRHSMKVLMVTSVGEHEGKSTVAANIAVTLAQAGKKVLLIDCDFRKPTQYLYFDVPKEEAVNLPEILRKHRDFSNLIRASKIENLYLIVNKAASFNVDEYLNNGVYEYILDFSRQQMDYVIVDSSPMALVSETVDLAQMCDATLLVIRQDTVLARDINDSIDVLNATNGKVIGCVLNDASGIRAGSTDKYGYGGHYGYGYGNYGGHYGK